MQLLELTEYIPRPGVPLTAAQRGALRAVGRVKVEPTPGTDDRYDLTPSSWVGVVHVDELTVHIRPKLPIERMLFLMSYALDPARWSDQPAVLGHERSLVEAIIPTFAHHARRAFLRGVLQGYRTREEALPVIRGRLRFDDQLRRRYGLFPPAEVRYDAFTEDIDENRLIRAAVRRLVRLPIRSRRAIGQLASIDAALEHVSVIDWDPRRLPGITYTRLNEHYLPAVELAKLILRAAAFEFRLGGVQATGFLVDMNTLFEEFVRVALREALGLSAQSFPKAAVGKKVRLDRERRVRLEPDLSWWRGGRCLFVGDVKYKKITAAGINHPDLYQLLAYTVATDLPTGMLIYAKGEEEPAVHEIAHAGKTLIVTALDLAGDVDAVLGRIRAVATWIRSMAVWRQLGSGYR